MELVHDENTIFRDRGPFVALFGEILNRNPSKHYLGILLGPVMKLACKIDPENPESAARIALTVLEQVSKLSNECPSLVSSVLRAVATALAEKELFNLGKWTIIESLVFLRWIGPAMTDPTRIQWTTDLSAPQQSMLVMALRLLLTMATTNKGNSNFIAKAGEEGGKYSQMLMTIDLDAIFATLIGSDSSFEQPSSVSKQPRDALTGQGHFSPSTSVCKGVSGTVSIGGADVGRSEVVNDTRRWSRRSSTSLIQKRASSGGGSNVKRSITSASLSPRIGRSSPAVQRSRCVVVFLVVFGILIGVVTSVVTGPLTWIYTRNTYFSLRRSLGLSL